LKKDPSIVHFISVSDARKYWADIINKVHYKGEIFIIKKHEKNFAAVIPLEDFDIIDVGDKIEISEPVDETASSSDENQWEKEFKKKLGL